MRVTDRIKEARLGIGMSVNKLSDLVGVSSTAAWNWDHHKTTPRDEQLVKIATALGVSKQWLLTGEEEPQDSPAAILAKAKAALATAMGVPEEAIRLELSVAA